MCPYIGTDHGKFRFKRNQVGKAGETHHHHGEPDRHSQEKQNKKQDNNSEDANKFRTH